MNTNFVAIVGCKNCGQSPSGFEQRRVNVQFVTYHQPCATCNNVNQTNESFYFCSFDCFKHYFLLNGDDKKAA